MSAVEANVENSTVSNEDGDGKPKTAKQLEKEAKKAAKLQKLQEKLDKKATVSASSKDKVEVSSFSHFSHCVCLFFCLMDKLRLFHFHVMQK